MKEGQEQILINIIRSDSWQLIEYNQTQENDITPPGHVLL
jgi:hypothetical protein